MFRSLIACGLTAWALAGCAVPAAREPEAKAVQQAEVVAQGMSRTSVTFVAAATESLAQSVSTSSNPGLNPDRPVWAVDFKGVFELSCGSQQTVADPTCPVNTTVRVVLDEASGDMILSETPAPGS